MRKVQYFLLVTFLLTVAVTLTKPSDEDCNNKASDAIKEYKKVVGADFL
jgi:hypothetical protein